jgi:FeS assembly SUF system protein
MSNTRPVSLGTEKLSPHTAGAGQTEAAPAAADSGKSLEERVIDVLRTVYDPEIPINIYELGLVYQLDVSPEGAVHIRMTLTSPACPVAGSLPGEVEARVKAVPGVTSTKVELVWDPPWDKSRLSEEAMLQLGLF